MLDMNNKKDRELAKELKLNDYAIWWFDPTDKHTSASDFSEDLSEAVKYVTKNFLENSVLDLKESLITGVKLNPKQLTVFNRLIRSSSLDRSHYARNDLVSILIDKKEISDLPKSNCVVSELLMNSRDINVIDKSHSDKVDFDHYAIWWFDPTIDCEFHTFSDTLYDAVEDVKEEFRKITIKGNKFSFRIGVELDQDQRDAIIHHLESLFFGDGLSSGVLRTPIVMNRNYITDIPNENCHVTDLYDNDFGLETKYECSDCANWRYPSMTKLEMIKTVCDSQTLGVGEFHHDLVSFITKHPFILEMENYHLFALMAYSDELKQKDFSLNPSFIKCPQRLMYLFVMGIAHKDFQDISVIENFHLYHEDILKLYSTEEIDENTLRLMRNYHFPYREYFSNINKFLEFAFLHADGLIRQKMLGITKKHYLDSDLADAWLAIMTYLTDNISDYMIKADVAISMQRFHGRMVGY